MCVVYMAVESELIVGEFGNLSDMKIQTIESRMFMCRYIGRRPQLGGQEFPQ